MLVTRKKQKLVPKWRSELGTVIRVAAGRYDGSLGCQASFPNLLAAAWGTSVHALKLQPAAMVDALTLEPTVPVRLSPARYLAGAVSSRTLS